MARADCAEAESLTLYRYLEYIFEVHVEALCASVYRYRSPRGPASGRGREGPCRGPAFLTHTCTLYCSYLAGPYQEVGRWSDPPPQHPVARSSI